jgi:hypothetical protein
VAALPQRCTELHGLSEPQKTTKPAEKWSMARAANFTALCSFSSFPSRLGRFSEEISENFRSRCDTIATAGQKI